MAQTAESLAAGTVEDLVATYQASGWSPEAYTALSTRCQRLIYHVGGRVLRRYPRARRDWPEVIAAGEMGLWEAARGWNADLRLRFTTYAFQRIRGAMLDHVRDACRRSRSVSLEAMLEDSDDTLGSVLADSSQQAAAQRDLAESLVHLVVMTCPGLEVEMVRRRYWQDQTYAEIAGAAGCSSARVQQLVKRALGRLRDAMATRPELAGVAGRN